MMMTIVVMTPATVMVTMIAMKVMMIKILIMNMVIK